MNCQDYVIGLEPCNYDPRLEYSKRAKILKPGEIVTYELEIGVIDSL